MLQWLILRRFVLRRLKLLLLRWGLKLLWSGDVSHACLLLRAKAQLLLFVSLQLFALVLMVGLQLLKAPCFERLAVGFDIVGGQIGEATLDAILRE